MERYFLLRNNEESGPFSLKELKAKSLFSTDLLWQDGESTAWKFPSEIPALADYFSSLNEPVLVPGNPKNTGIIVKRQPVTVSTLSTKSSPALMNDPSPSFDELAKKYAEKAPRKKARKSLSYMGANLFGLTILLFGIAVAAIMIKNAIDSNAFAPLVATAQAHEIQGENANVSTTQHTGKGATDIVQIVNKNTASEAALQSTVELTQTTKPVRNNSISISKNPADSDKTLPLTDDNNKVIAVKNEVAENSTKDSSPANEKSADENKESDVVKTEKPVSKPSLQVVANDYKVGLLGGISHLELSLTNPSTQVVDHATVEVEFLKPNGKIVNSQNFDVAAIAPGSSKKISVPDNSRGVSVRYRVSNIEAHVGKPSSKDM